MLLNCSASSAPVFIALDLAEEAVLISIYDIRNFHLHHPISEAAEKYHSGTV